MRRFGRKRYLRRLRGEEEVKDLREALQTLLTSLGGDPVKGRLAEIWRQWKDILGEELAELALPMGTDKKQLLIGVEDALVMQEIQFRKQEILQKVNLRLGEEYFESVRASIMLGREARETTPSITEPARGAPLPPKAAQGQARGTNLDKMDPNSAVARAYAIFADRNKN